MPGGNGKTEHFYQRDVGDTAFNGQQKRHPDQIQLTEENEKVVEVMRRIVDGGCKRNCPIDEDVQKDIPGAIDAVKEVGEGNFKHGINIFRDQAKEVGEILTTKKDLTKRVMSYVLIMVVSAIGTLIVAGFYAKARGG